MALIFVGGTVAAILLRAPAPGYPWWYNAWLAITGGAAPGAIAWLTALAYTAYEELEVMVFSHMARERDREAAERALQAAAAQLAAEERERMEIERKQAMAELQQAVVEARQTAVAQQAVAEAQRATATAQQAAAEAQQAAAEARQQTLEIREQELVRKEAALQNLAEHLPPEYRAEFERLTNNGAGSERER